MKIHLVSIGGAVMHNMALALKNNGHDVSGSDDEIFEPSRSRLSAAGLLPNEMGWHPERLTSEVDMVILGMHARKDNPEMARALELGIPVLSFPEYVYEHAKDKKRIVIGGSHGKTTTTAMIMHALKELNIDFDYLVGSQLEGFETMVRFSDAGIMVIEGDEYLTSALDPRPKFHWYRPHIAVLTGIAWDHINVFPTYELYLEQFKIFCRELMSDSTLFYYGGDKDLSQIARLSPGIKIPYQGLEYFVEEGQTAVKHKDHVHPFEVYGEHNFQNMDAALKVCTELGLEEEAVVRALSTFKGTARRLETVYQNDNLVIIRDFAHSPSKTRASTNAVRSLYPTRQLVAVFELHTFSSLNRDFIPHYQGTLFPADKALVYYDPHVIEHKRLPKVEPEFVQQSFENVEVFTDRDALQNRIKELLTGNDVLLLMSSGTFAGMDIHSFA